jgi:hypothetical protein
MKRRISVQFCWITSSSESVTRLASHARIGGGGGMSSQCSSICLAAASPDEAFERRVGGEAVGKVEARLADLAGGPEAGKIGPPVEVDHPAQV